MTSLTFQFAKIILQKNIKGKLAWPLIFQKVRDSLLLTEL
ncbi:hypothetical protein LBUL87_1337 [Lactobacillus delbrueckii subsp. bulgaricus]|nr:hypothetical protein BBD26_1431 [Lactobacillus delbrueckii subsp. bulgaricus]SNR19917.1 hypothetical protein LBUL87_1337 [Lactobacillus delbrueckii subsp. bulgaricus]